MSESSHGPDSDGTANPWTRRSRAVAYQNPWITVYHDEVTRPDGSIDRYTFNRESRLINPTRQTPANPAGRSGTALFERLKAN